MTTDQTQVLSLESNLDAFRVQCFEPGAAPTVSISAGDNITVEIDITRPSAPVSVSVHDTYAAAGSLYEIFGAPTGRELIRRARILADGDNQEGQASPPLTFTPGSAWNGLLAAAYQQWTLYWNPLPLDKSLNALDIVAAGHLNRAFDGAETARLNAAEALPAARALQRLLDAGLIDEIALSPVRAALDALDEILPTGTPGGEDPYTLPLPLSEMDRDAILYNTSATSAIQVPGLLLIGSPDWRLTGHGEASTAEDTIRVVTHARNPHAITVTVPTQRTTATDPTAHYHAIVTEPHTGSLIAHVPLKPASGDILAGHSLPARAIRPTDYVDIRHRDIPGYPEPSPEQRHIDRTKRVSARNHIQDRLTLNLVKGALPATLTELAHAGRLLILEEARIDDLDLAWFRLEASDSIAVRSRGEVRRIFKAKDPATRTSFTMMLLPDGLWLVVISPGPRVNSAVLRWETRWSTGEITRHECALDETDSVRIVAPILDATPVMIRSVDE
ncbi:hypothetical protein ASF98_18845 [Arthrobacter sp. Leaf337]|uniref:hypothetical protein n=1 Tax=Arthrobacter sp. Leaf337 TaxID=1736342 RepID=UPI0006F23387|nr:hypothetical protein [Arthrobacter sp. Leaf337]KQR80353.1 hypothetical protein ASF98_18845 [Arthrobacter sp. Leaf337]